MSPEELRETHAALAQRWGVPERNAGTDESDYAYLLEVLTERVHGLMLRNSQKLMTALYILDVSERRYRDAMSGRDMASRAKALARVILERETEKIISRRKYAAPSNTPLPETQQEDQNP